ncbi:hypothetical protein C1H46_009567 [Malus baccata]|uniref:Serine incorporator n=1 Tax=Malus baccata TaxID=106549 RepID=A0A540N2T2_MALBA|nr:hypothetical protein C1H46_009567 [Malus baccata]
MEEGGSAGNYQRSGLKVKVDSWFSQFRNGSNPWMARYVYGFMFLIANLMAWGVRDYGRNVLTEMESKICFLSSTLLAYEHIVIDSINALSILNECVNQHIISAECLKPLAVSAGLKGCHGVKDCLGAEGVLRLFYITMFLSTAGTSKLNEPRDSWQSGWWSAKIVMWISFIIIPFLLPATIIQLYGEIAHFGAGVFLLIQLISIISFITWLNDCCQSTKSERCRIHVMLLATAAYVVCLVGIILMYIWYAPEPTCLLNIFFITWTLVLLQLMTSVSLHPKVNAGILTPGLMGLYIVFICWFAIRSEPAGTSCNKKADDSTKKDWLTIISFVIAVLAMVIATFSTGIDSKCFQFRKDETESEDDVPYGYGFFHFVFATGAMYFGMLLIGWNTHQSMRRYFSPPCL